MGQLKHRYLTEVIEHSHATGVKTQIPEVTETQSRNWFNKYKHFTKIIKSQSRNWDK